MVVLWDSGKTFEILFLAINFNRIVLHLFDKREKIIYTDNVSNIIIIALTVFRLDKK